MMQIELYGGAQDGLLMVVPDGTTVWVIKSPAMSTADFIALENSHPSAPMPVRTDLGYQVTEEKNPRTGAFLARYVGERAKA
jgi:hypothetical protein